MPSVRDSAELPALLRSSPRVARLLEAGAGEEGLWLVGGAVRDLLLGGEAVDLDVVVEGDAPGAATRLAGRLGGRARVHERFGTATVEAPELVFDLTTSRRETYARPGALPDVEPAPLEEDLVRRDFTVNALAAALSGAEPGALRAPPGALDDLGAGLLRVFHQRSFVDDPTRLLRLVRYAERLGFEPEPETAALAEEAAGEGALGEVSGPRIGAELRLLLREARATEALERLRPMGLDRALHPAFEPDAELAARATALLGRGGARHDLVVLAAGCRGFSEGGLRRWLDALGFEASEREVVVRAAIGGPALAERLRLAGRPSEIAAAARGQPVEAIALAGALGAEDEARRWLEELRLVSLDIAGDDLIAAGVPEGPDVGRALDAALAAKLDGEVSGREEELRVALAAVGRG